MQVIAQWAGYCQNAAKSEDKVWAAAVVRMDDGSRQYMAIWRHDMNVAMAGQVKMAGHPKMGDPEDHYAAMVAAKKKKGYAEIEFEALTPEYVPSFKQTAGRSNEAMAIAQGGYVAFGRNKGTDLPLVDLQVSLGADLDPDPLVHAVKLMDLLAEAGNGYPVTRLLLGYQRAKIRLEVYAEYGRKAAQRKAAGKLLGEMRNQMQTMLAN